MPQTVGQHGLASFANPENGDPLDATVVRANDNTTRDAYVSHDSDGGIHVQSSAIASRPVAGVVGRKWMTTDTGDVRLWYDTGAVWAEIDYLRAGGTPVIADLTVTGNTILGDANTDTLAVNAELTTSLVPDTTNAIDLGTAAKAFREVFAQRARLNNVPYTFPASQGALDSYLKNNGSGSLTWEPFSATVPDIAVTPTIAAPYDVTTAAANARIVVNSTQQAAVRFSRANTDAIAVNAQVSIAARGASTRLFVAGAPDPSWTPSGGLAASINGAIHAWAEQSDGKILAAGNFSTISGVSKTRIARFNTDGTLDTGFTTTVNSVVYAIGLQSDGKIIIGGAFSQVNGTTVNRLARINTDGTLDGTFTPDTPNGTFVQVVRVLSNDKIVIGGDFSLLTASGLIRNRMAVLNSTGVVDTAFGDPNVDAVPYAILVQPSDGKYIIAGAFANVGGVVQNRIGRVNTNGTRDATFVTPDSGVITNTVSSAVLDSTERVIVAVTVAGSGGGLYRFSALGANDATFRTNFTSSVPSTAGYNINCVELGPDDGVMFVCGGNTQNYYPAPTLVFAAVNVSGFRTCILPGQDQLLVANTAENAARSIFHATIGNRIYVGRDGAHTTTTLGVVYTGVMRLFGFGSSGFDAIQTPERSVYNLPVGSQITVQKLSNGRWAVVSFTSATP